MAGPEEILKTRVTIEGDISGLKESVQDAKKEVKGVADEAENTGGRVNSAFAKAGEGIERSTSGVRKFVGALSSVAGVATGVLGVIGLVTGAFVALKTALESIGGDGDKEKPLPKANELLKELADNAMGVTDALSVSPGFVSISNDIEELEKKIKSLKKTKSISSPNIDQDIQLEIYEDNLRRIAQLEDELAEKRVQRADLLDKLGSDKKAESEAQESLKNQTASLEAIKKIADSISIQLLPDDQRIEETAKRQIEQIQALAKEAGIDLEDFYVRAAITGIEEKSRRELELLESIENKRIQQEKDAIQRRIAQEQQAADAYANRLREQLDGIFNSDFVGTFTGLEQALRDISRNTGRLK